MALRAFRSVVNGNSVFRLRSVLARYEELSLITAGRLCYSSAASDHPTQTAGQTVVTERKGVVVTVGINRPEARNSVNRETAFRLIKELSAFDQDDTLSVAVLHGLGGYFCAGLDLKELSTGPDSLKLVQDVTQGPGPMGPSRMTLSKPLIAAVSGYAVAGGLELALLADIRVVEESAIFGIFCRRFGVPLIDGGTVRLPALIGLSRALDLILTGRPVGAQEALAFGLANRVVPDGQALQAAVELAEQISSFPQLCLRADCNSAYHSTFDSSSFTEAMQFEMDRGQPIIAAESVKGAGRFAAGTGRGGKFFEPDQK
ncbi:probable enoyl-CoA hydratase isoform X1 [Astyanax mexicanus]|uniref:probable enoyl-CoA hydratase isoform X1 n=1 Tax=Astyanax mexicanus TaxID=7994 RepID=UPI0020CB3E55|nr:probable enoyl-CoA hydratase isoform X1 [Astyanax mexicanus]